MSAMKASQPAQEAFSLVEVVLALGITTFALIAILGLLPMALKSNRDTYEESRAVTLLEAMIADRKFSAASSNSLVFQIPCVTNATTNILYLKDDGSLTTGPDDARYRVTATAYPSTNNVQPNYLHLRASWPPRAGDSASSVEMNAAFAP